MRRQVAFANTQCLFRRVAAICLALSAALIGCADRKPVEATQADETARLEAYDRERRVAEARQTLARIEEETKAGEVRLLTLNSKLLELKQAELDREKAKLEEMKQEELNQRAIEQAERQLAEAEAEEQRWREGIRKEVRKQIEFEQREKMRLIQEQQRSIEDAKIQLAKEEQENELWRKQVQQKARAKFEKEYEDLLRQKTGHGWTK